MKINLHNPNEIPNISKDDESFSEDVFVIDESGMNSIGFYCYESKRWRFHTDTVVDLLESGEGTKWKWYYPPITVADCKF